MKKVRINKKGEYKDTSNQTFYNYKVFLFGRGFWISELDYKETESLKIDGEYLILKEPLDKHYQVVVKNGSKGSFLTLKPIISTPQDSEPPAVGEPDIEYQNKTKTEKDSEASKVEEQQKSNEEVWNMIKSGKKSELDQLLVLDNQPTRLNSIISKWNLDPKKQIFPSEEEIKEIFENFPELGAPQKTEPAKLQPKLDPKKRITLSREEIKELTEEFTELGLSPQKIPTSESNSKWLFMQSLLKLSMGRNVVDKTRGRIINLIGQEVGRSTITREEVEMIVDEKLNKGSNVGAIVESPGKFEIDLTKHKPLNLVHFIDKFRDSEGIKFLTHSYEKQDGFNRERILEIAEKEYLAFTQANFISYSFWEKFNTFAFGRKYKDKVWIDSNQWFFNQKRIQLTWRSKQVIDWCNNNPGMHPIERFEEEMIKPFQMSYKLENGNLELYLKEKLAKALQNDYGNFEIQLIDCEKAAFKTDVDSLLAALNGFFASIKQRKDKSNKIKIHFSRKGRKRFLYIVHVDSFSDKSFEEEEKDILSGDLNGVKKNLFNVCDWSIISNNPSDRFNKINILFDIGQLPSREKTKEKIEGFTHMLTFYS